MKLRLGTFLSLGSPVVAELTALLGLDWVLIDLEHGNGTESDVPAQLNAIRGSATRGIVRVGAPYPDLIARVLDWGAHGIMVPHVDSAAKAEAIVQAAHYAPRGHRGYSRSVRAHAFGLRPAEESPLPMIIAQIETARGVKHAAEIAAIDGIDVLFVGPADLRYDLKQQPAAAGSDFAHSLIRVVEAAKGSGKAAGILVRDLEDFRHCRGLGFTYIAVDSDLSILRKSWEQTIQSCEG